MLSHLDVPGFAGGGVTGVTLFFVLSGFLITSLLLDERAYAGRSHSAPSTSAEPCVASRIGALIAGVCVVSLSQYVFAKVPFYYRSDSAVCRWRSVRACSSSPTGFAPSVGLGHLAHTWSLAVEEQFYILWPTTLLVLAPWRAHRRRLALGALVALSAVMVGLRFGLWHATHAGDFVYFSTVTRADAILVGAAVALWMRTGPS